MYRCAECGAFNRIRPDHPRGEAHCGSCKGKLDLSGAPQEVNAEEYARAIASSPVPVVVDFWAPWCPPCRAVAPIVDGFGRGHAGKVVVLKVNSDRTPALLSQLGVAGIPSFFAFESGQEVGRHSGALPAHAFQRWAEQAFHRAAA